ncbi:hypothetical protein D9M71_345140 [compost metagenome]
MGIKAERIRLVKPRICIRGHLLEHVSYDRDYACTPTGSGWLKIVDDTGKTIFLSNTMQKDHFVAA